MDLLRKYLEDKLNKYREMEKEIEEMQNIKELEHKITQLLENNDFPSILEEEFEKITTYIFGEGLFKEKQDILRNLKILGGFLDMSDQEQILQLRSDLEKLKRDIINNSQKLEIDIFTKSKRNKEQADVYKKYLSYFDENGDIKKLDERELSELFDFIKQINFDEETIMEMSKQLSEKQIEHYKNEKKRVKIMTPEEAKQITESKQITEEKTSNVNPLTQEENDEIHKYILLANEELKLNLTEEQKKNFETLIEYVKCEDISKEEYNKIIQSLQFKKSYEYVKCIYLFEKLVDLYGDYEELYKNSKEYKGVDAIEYDEYMQSKTTELRQVMEELKENYETYLKQINTENKSESNTSTIKNIMIFMPNSKDGGYYMADDQMEIIEEDKDAIKNIVSSIKILSTNDFNEIRTKKYNDKKVKPTDNIADYSDELKTRRISQGEGRIAYIRIPLDGNNRTKIKNKFGYGNDVNIVLVVNCGCKKSADTKVYHDTNSRISKEIIEIRKIKELFGKEFDVESFAKAIALIEDGQQICAGLLEDPYKKIPTQKGGKNNDR